MLISCQATKSWNYNEPPCVGIHSDNFLCTRDHWSPGNYCACMPRSAVVLEAHQKAQKTSIFSSTWLYPSEAGYHQNRPTGEGRSPECSDCSRKCFSRCLTRTSPQVYCNPSLSGHHLLIFYSHNCMPFCHHIHSKANLNSVNRMPKLCFYFVR